MATELVFTGTVYPPSAVRGDEEKRTVEHLCSEFSGAELDKLCAELHGLKVCVEHDLQQLVGVVEKATRSHSDGISITARITANSEAGKQAIRDIQSHNMRGLSLSHLYVLAASKDEPVMEEDSVSCDKKAIEVSLCKNPARPGCFIDSIVSVGAVAAHKQESEGDVYKKNLVIFWALHNCSNMESVPTPAPVETPPVETAAQAQPEAQQEAQPEAQPEAQHEAQPETQPEAQPEEQPEAPAEEEGKSTADLLQEAAKALSAQREKQEAAEKAHIQQQQEIKQELEKARQELAEAKASAARAEETKKRLEKEAAAKAKADEKAKRDELQRLLHSCSGAAAADGKKEKDLSKLLQDSINTIKEQKTAIETGNMSAAQHKRTLEAMAPFQVDRALVNASAAEPAPKRTRTEEETLDKELRRVCHNNGETLTFKQMQKYLETKMMQPQVGMVSASADDYLLKNVERPSQPKLCMLHMYPTAFNEINSMMKGRCPDSHEVVAMMNATNKPGYMHR